MLKLNIDKEYVRGERMKRLCLMFLFVCLFLSSCSFSSNVSDHKCYYISDSTLTEEAEVVETVGLLSAECTEITNADVSKYSNNSVTIYYPLFNDEFVDGIIKGAIDSHLNGLSSDVVACFDFFVSSGQGGISIIFYDSTSVSSSLRNVFSVTFSDDYSKTLSLESFIDAKSPTDHVVKTVDKLYGGEGAFKHNKEIVFYTDPKGITVIDTLGQRFSIPKESFNGRASRLVTVGKDYNPVQQNEKVIALTFDDGPNYKTTSYLLSILKEKGVKATFFTVGYNIPGNEYLLRRMIDHGCDVGIHSYAHQNFNTMTYEQVKEDIEKCGELIKNATDIAPYLVRAPFGNVSEEIVSEKEYYFINWCVDPYDWTAETPEEVYEHVINHARSGSIVLMHDLYSNSCDATALIIDKLKADGWRFVTVSEMFDMKNNSPSGKIYYGLGY